jgi:carbon monoxide dehydrogenase subunit G
MGKDCGCSKSEDHKDYSCEAIVEGKFTRKDGVVFTATMSATGGASTCEKAKEAAKANANKTLEHFLETYKPKIVDYTYKIKIDCDEKCDGKKYNLEAKLPGVVEFIEEADMFTYKATVFADEKKRDKFLEFSGSVMPEARLGGMGISQHTTSTNIYSNPISVNVREDDGKKGGTFGRTAKLALAYEQVNSTALTAYAVAAQLAGELAMVGDSKMMAARAIGSASLPGYTKFDTAFIGCPTGDSECTPKLTLNELQYEARFDLPNDTKKPQPTKINFDMTLTAKAWTAP